jgi:hypothetical protein
MSEVRGTMSGVRDRQGVWIVAGQNVWDKATPD